MTDERRPCIITTSHRDVWYGYTDAQEGDKSATLHDARHCYYWGTSEGLGELAKSGPGKSGQIGAEVPRITINDVVAVMDCTAEAEARFAEQGWGGPRE